MNKARSRIDYILKHNRFISKVFRFCVSLCVKILGVFIPIDDKAIIFSGHSRKYNDSPRAIYEYMISCPDYRNFQFYWALEDLDTEIPGNAIKILPDNLNYFKTALKCKYWITCVNIERSLKFKKKKCVYLNTWHGIPIKTVGNMAEGRKDYDFSYIDYFCVSGNYEIDLYKQSFNVGENQIIKTGLPRNDELYYSTKEEILQLKKKMNIPLNKKIILYAPTWRDSKDGGVSYSIAPPIDINKWKEQLEKEYILIMRTHPYTNKALEINFDDFVRDFSNYDKINDLLIIADILISDYSATIFDYSILERPIISFAYDCEEYGRERGFSLNPTTEMPGGIEDNEDDVIKRILNMDYEYEVERVKAFKEKYVMYGGHATEACVNALFKK